MRFLLPVAVLCGLLHGCGGTDQPADAPASRKVAAAAPAAANTEVVLPGLRAAYAIAASGSAYTVSGNGRTVSYPAGTRLRFDDVSTILDAEGQPGKLYRLYRAAFNRIPDTEGIGYWMAQTDMSIAYLAELFIGSPEFVQLYGQHPDDAQFVRLLYANVLHREPDSGGYEYWMKVLADGTSRTTALLFFSESPENRGLTDSATAQGIDFLPYGAGKVQLLAGTGITAGLADGKGQDARFTRPRGLALGPDGTLYVADQFNVRVRKVTPDGTVTTLPFLTDDTPYPESPFAIAVDANGNLYITNELNHTVRMVTPAGQITRLAGQPGKAGGTDGDGGAAEFDTPTGIAVDRQGNVYVFSAYTLRKISAGSPRRVTTLAGAYGVYGKADGNGTQARFNRSAQLTVDSKGNIYVAETSAIRKVTPAGVVTTLPASPVGVIHTLNGIAVDSEDNLYVSDARSIGRWANDRWEVIAGAYWAGGYVDGAAADARFTGNAGIAVGTDRTIYIAESTHQTIRAIAPDRVVRTLAGRSTLSWRIDGPVGTGSFSYVRGTAVLPDGNVLVSDDLFIRNIAPDGKLSTVAGSGGSGLFDGSWEQARFNSPTTLAVDPAGNVFFSDSGRLRKLGVDRTVTTYPYEVATDSVALYWSAAHGTLLAASQYGKNVQSLAIAASGIRDIPLPGMPAPSLDARDMVTDSAGNIYIADGTHHVIRKLDRSGRQTIVAGQYDRPAALDGSGDRSLLYYPSGLAMGRMENLYIADTGNHVIRKLTPDGTLAIVAGTYQKGGLRTGSLPGLLFQPKSIHIPDENTLITTCGTNVIKITLH